MGRLALVVLPDREVDALLEYSCSEPTGQIVGKRWKSLPASFDRSRRTPLVRYLREYTEHPDPAKIGIHTNLLLTETEAAAVADVVFWWVPRG